MRQVNVSHFALLSTSDVTILLVTVGTSLWYDTKYEPAAKQNRFWMDRVLVAKQKPLPSRSSIVLVKLAKALFEL